MQLSYQPLCRSLMGQSMNSGVCKLVQSKNTSVITGFQMMQLSLPCPASILLKQSMYSHPSVLPQFYSIGSKTRNAIGGWICGGSSPVFERTHTILRCSWISGFTASLSCYMLIGLTSPARKVRHFTHTDIFWDRCRTDISFHIHGTCCLNLDSVQVTF